MVTFDSPLARCEKCGQFVLMDQTVRECADEHRCDARECPTAKFFEGAEVPSPDDRRKTTAPGEDE